MNTRLRILLFLPLSLVALIRPCGAMQGVEYSAQDTDLTVDPVVRLFPVTTLGTDSAPAEFRITNSNATQTRTLGALTLDGPHSDQFALGANMCSGVTLSANGGYCTVSVKFHPTSRGSKGACLLIPSNDPETPTLTAFMANYEAPAGEAMRRMPPVLSALTIPNTMIPGQTYSLAWSLAGYHLNYSSVMALFDCTGVAADCGANYGDATRFAESGTLGPVSVTPGVWQFNGVVEQRFNYAWSFTVPLKREDGSDWPAAGTDIVIRFYSTDDIDQERNKGSVSLMVPGNLGTRYYDTAGRRIVTQIKP